MRHRIRNAALISILTAVLIETAAYFKGWRPDFFSFTEVLSCLLFSVFIFLPVFGIYIAIKKLSDKSHEITLFNKIIAGTVSLTISTTVVYFDDNNGLNSFFSFSGIFVFSIISLILFILFSFILIGFRKVHLDEQNKNNPRQ